MSLESRAAWFVKQCGTMCRLPIMLAVSLLATTASADVAAVIGVGASRIEANGDTPILPALDVFVGGRLDEHWSLGGRLQTTWPVHSSEVLYAGGGGDIELADYTIEAMDLGLSGRYEDPDHGWWVAPWIGAHVASVKDHDYGQAVGNSFDSTSTFNAYAFEAGLMAGVDVYDAGSDKVSIYADYHHVVGPTSDSVQGWAALTVGLAYRR